MSQVGHLEAGNRPDLRVGIAPDEVESAAKLVAQARRRYAGLEPRIQRQRLDALLARRGYDSDIIRRALELKEPLESGAEG